MPHGMFTPPVGAVRRSRYRGPVGQDVGDPLRRDRTGVECLPCEIRRIFLWGEIYSSGVGMEYRTGVKSVFLFNWGPTHSLIIQFVSGLLPEPRVPPRRDNSSRTELCVLGVVRPAFLPRPINIYTNSKTFFITDRYQGIG